MTHNMNIPSHSPKPPDCPELPDFYMDMDEDKQNPSSFKEILLNKGKELNLSYSLEEHSPNGDSESSTDPIILTEEEKARIYNPWKNSLRVKIFEKKWPMLIWEIN